MKYDIWDRNAEPAPEQPAMFYRISLCTTVMNRLADLKQTLLKNILDNMDYGNIEFVVLDYNSSDGLGDWIKDNMSQFLQTGRLAYYRTEEPKFFSMAHSRNIAFKLATGDIVNNVDADNFVNPGFATYLNRIANLRPRKAVFAKGKRAMHGRIGFWQDEFINELGGYDEVFQGYGYDDHDLYNRAMHLGYRLMWYGGAYCARIPTSRQQKVANMENKNWKATERLNKQLSATSINSGLFRANGGYSWGNAHVVKNFKEWLST